MKKKNIQGAAYDSILLAIIQVVTYATNIITTKMLSSALSLNEYGTYSTVNTIITIAASLTLFGLGDSLNYFYNRNNETKDANSIQKEHEEYVNTIFSIQLILGIVVGIMLIGLSNSMSSYYKNPLVKPLIIIVCLKPWISNATHLYQVLFVSIGKARWIAIRNFIISILKIVIISIAIYIFKSLKVIFVCLVVLDAIQLIIFRIIFGKLRFRVRPLTFKKEKITPVFLYAVPMGVYFVTSTLMREIDKLVIGRFGTTSELAIYSNCAKALPLNILVTSFATVLIPFIMHYVSSREYRKTGELIKKYLKIGYLSVWMFSSALMLCAPEAIRFFYSSEYISGKMIFYIYILDGMIQFASVHLVVAANGEAKYLMRVSIGLLAINAILSIAMYKLFEVVGVATVGPAIATLIISIIYVFLLFTKTSKILQLRKFDFLPIRDMLVYLIQLGICGVALYGLKSLLYWLGMNWFVIFVIIAGLYCCAMTLLHIKEYKGLFLDINRLKHEGIRK